MFTRILIGYDGSAEARAGLVLARALARGDATLIVAHVQDRAPGADDGPDPRRSTSVLTSARDLLAGWPAVELCACTDPSVASALHRIARETMCDLLVVGAGRHHGVGRVLLGSDAEASLHGAPCPVVVATADPRTPIRRVGVAFDGTPLGRRTVTAAARLCASLGASLTVLGVVDTRHVHAAFGT
jgi:nucleotide-binding universal stress UspA family protein